MAVASFVLFSYLHLFCYGLTFYGTSGSYVTVRGVGMYKLHEEKKTYNEAAQLCKQEGAHLAVINSKEEEDAIIDLLGRTSADRAYIGVNDIAIEGFMATVLGELWSSVGYSKWASGEPNDSGGREDCVFILKESRLLNDCECSETISFVCEIQQTSISSRKGLAVGATFSQSDGYVKVPGVGSYRLHLEGTPYSEADQVCEGEGGHLLVINSKEEEDVAVNLMQGARVVWAFVGIDDLAREGTMVTILGEPLAAVGYYRWRADEPNDSGGVEDCATINTDRLINDEMCGKGFYFLCEKYPESTTRAPRSGGYVTVPGVGSYMLHEQGLPFNSAALVCESEGAHLAVINSRQEEDVLMNLLNGSLRAQAFIGVSDKVKEGEMATVLGEVWAKVGYSKWAPGEPNDENKSEDCVAIGKDRLLKDIRCGMKIQYFCEKSATGTVFIDKDPPAVQRTTYIDVPNVGSYKLHLEMKTYSEATRICVSEGTHLAIVNSKTEEDTLVNLFTGTQRTEAYIGVNDIAVEGHFVTVFDEPFLRDGFYRWNADEPRHNNGLEDCVVLGKNRAIAVRECGERAGFLCEKTHGCPILPVDPSVDIECTLNKVPVDCYDKYASPGTIATMTCIPGYRHESRNKFFTTLCQANNTWSDRFVKCEKDCGRTSVSSGQAYISRGYSVAAGALPWHVGIFKHNKGTYTQLCGGTLVTPFLVVTAAHCFWNKDTESAYDKSMYRVAAGQISINWEKPERDTQKRDVAELILPDQFTGYVNFHQSDIAIVRLSHRVDISRTVNVICVDWKNQLSAIVEGANGTVAGWGLNENKTQSEHLMAVQLAYMPYKQCWDMFKSNRAFRPFITSDKLCAGWTGRGTSVCPGDSGGGLVFPKATKAGNRYYLRGIVSVGPTALSGKCNSDNVAAFTDIAAHLPFLRQHVKP